MADYGFRAINGVNEVQIDSTYRNLSLRSKGTAFANLASAHVNFKFAQIVVPDNQGMIAFRCPAPCVIASIYPGGGGLVVNFLVYAQDGAVNPVYWYLFDQPVYSSLSGNYGMRIKDAAGNITHDSRMDYMKFTDFVSGTLSQLPTTSSGLAPQYLFFVKPGTLPAVLQGVTCSSQTEVPIGVGSGVQYMQFFFWQMFAQINDAIGTAWCVQDFGPSTIPGNVVDIRRENFTITIIDVAKYA